MKKSVTLRVTLASALLALAHVQSDAAVTLGGACANVPLSSSDSTTGGAVASAGSQYYYSDCETAPGYYLKAAEQGGGDLVIAVCPAGYYCPGGDDLEDTTAQWFGTGVIAAAATITKCPTNSGTGTTTGSTSLSACMCQANYFPTTGTCAACASGTTRAGTVSVTGSATCAAAGAGADAARTLQDAELAGLIVIGSVAFVIIVIVLCVRRRRRADDRLRARLDIPTHGAPVEFPPQKPQIIVVQR